MIEAIKRSSKRAEPGRVPYAATTLIEFGTQIERDQAETCWPLDQEAPADPRRPNDVLRSRTMGPYRTRTAPGQLAILGRLPESA